MNIAGRIGAAVAAFRSGYAAARDPIGRKPWRAPKGGPNRENGRAALTIAARARDAVRNNPYASRIVETWVANAVGTGITTRWPAGSKQAEAWAIWSEGMSCDCERTQAWAGLQSLAFRGVVESGEALVRFRQVRPTRDNPVGLELLVMEGDRLDWSLTATSEQGNRIVQGIEIDRVGAPVAYWLMPPDEMNWMTRPSPSASERVPAQDIIHLFRRRRPGQMRDVSWLAPVLWPLRDLGHYEASLMLKADIESRLAVIVTDDTDETLTGSSAGLVKDAYGQNVEALEAGMILYRRGNVAGGGVDVINPSGGGSHLGFAKRTLEAASVGAGLTYDQVSGDLSEANYSSLRAGKIEFRQMLAQVQYTMLVPQLVQRVTRRFHDAGVLAGLWPDAMPKPEHVPPAPEMIDPLKDGLSLIALVRAGFKPPQDAAGELGYDWTTLVAMITEANKDRDREALIQDSDPRRTAGSGGAQNAAQNAAIELGKNAAA